MSDESTKPRPPSEIDLLRAEMRAGFESVDKRLDKVDERFEQVDKRFEQVDKRFEQVDKRFEQVDKRFDEVDRRFDQVDKRFDQVDKRFAGVDTRGDGVDKRLDTLDARITEEAATTRRHFDVVAESLRADIKVVIDIVRATNELLDRTIATNAVDHAAFVNAIMNHEGRITRLEDTTGLSNPPTS